MDALGLIRDYKRGVCLFGEAIEKACLPPGVDPADEAFTGLLKQFERFLQEHGDRPWGIVLVDHDAKKQDRYTAMLRNFQRRDGLRGGVDRIIEAPFFLDSQSNSGVQVADLCCYAVRRYVENGENEAFRTIFSKFYRVEGRLCGLRHISAPACTCSICGEPVAEPFQPRPRPRRANPVIHER